MARKYCSSILFVVVLASILAGPVGPTTPPARADSSTSSDPTPLHDRWTPTSKTFLNADGTLTTEEYSSPIQTKDASSATGWSPVSTDLQSTADGLSPESTPADITISDGTDDAAPIATVAQDGQSIAVASDGSVPAPSVEGDTATYPDVQTGVDETVQARASGVEVNYVVDSAADAPTTIEVPLQLDGLTASLDDQGNLTLTNQSGAVVGGAEPAQMWGSATDPSTGEPVVQEPVPTTLENGPDGPVLVLTPDYSDPALSYPW